MMCFLIIAVTFLLAFTHYTVTDAWECSTCSITYEAVGCFKDDNHRPLTTEILNERDPKRKDIFEGNVIDWMNWDNYMGAFACRCAAKTKKKGWTVFGLQFYGECWSGPELDAHKKMSLSDKCIGKGYRKCSPSERHCVGEAHTNMVYRIVPECEIKFEKLGCNNDPRTEPRPLPEYIMTDRDSAHKVSSGRMIDWQNWDAYLPELACRCAKKAKEKGYDTFGLQYYGECWSGAQAAYTYNNQGPSPNCVDRCFKPCKKHSKFCAGEQFTNFVYRLSDTMCEISLEEVGCFNEKPSDRALEKELVNQVQPLSQFFNGNYLDSRTWDEEFPLMLCRCARIAKAGGFTVFGVHNHGTCWSGTNAEVSYKKHGKSSKCFNNFEKPCKPGELKCAGGPSTQFAYKIKMPVEKCDIKLKRLGCYRDVFTKPLPQLILTDRVMNSDVSSGKSIDWINWEKYLPDLACRCAKKAKEKGFKVFGLQNYGECWSGANAEKTYNKSGESINCVDQWYKPCKPSKKYCAGQIRNNFVYMLE